MHPSALVSALIAGLADLVSGWVGLRWRSERLESRYIIAFAAGMLIGVVFFDLLPEIDMERDAALVVLGFFAFYLLEKVMMIHACGESECEVHQVGPVAVVGMALDNVVDGVGIAAGFVLSPFLGAAITLAVVLHEIPQGIASAFIMRQAHWDSGRIYLTLGAAGALYPIGAFLAGFIPETFTHAALAFIAGDFLYIGASDLLPEAHRRFNWKVVAATLLGASFMWGLTLVAPVA